MLGGQTTGPVPEDRDRLTVISIAGGRASAARRRLSHRLHLHDRYPVGAGPRGRDLLPRGDRQRSDPIDRALLYLEQIGKLDGVRGVVVGELAGCEWYEYSSAPRSKTLEDVLNDRLGGLGIPVLYGLPLGHGASLATLPLGVEATIDADALTLTIDEPALSSPGLSGKEVASRRQRQG